MRRRSSRRATGHLVRKSTHPFRAGRRRDLSGGRAAKTKRTTSGLRRLDEGHFAIHLKPGRRDRAYIGSPHAAVDNQRILVHKAVGPSKLDTARRRGPRKLLDREIGPR